MREKFVAAGILITLVITWGLSGKAGPSRGEQLLKQLKLNGFQGVENLSEPDISAIKEFKAAQETRLQAGQAQRTKDDLYSLLLRAAPQEKGEELLNRRLKGYQPISQEEIRWLVDQNLVSHRGIWVGGSIRTEIGSIRTKQDLIEASRMEETRTCWVELYEAPSFAMRSSKPEVNWLVRKDTGQFLASPDAVNLLPKARPNCVF